MLTPTFRSIAGALLLKLLLAGLWGMFSYANISAFERNGDWTYLLIAASESVVALLFLTRSQAQTVSSAALDWALAIGATFAPFLFTPTATGILPQAKLMVVAGVLLQLAGLLSLNRSFGLIAARRQIKTCGMYRVVRHPLYASYLLSFGGYVLINTSPANLAIYATTMILLLFRLRREEIHLAQDGAYRRYMQRVPYRVIPLVF